LFAVVSSLQNNCGRDPDTDVERDTEQRWNLDGIRKDQAD
jgi:hypothetical protein